jgi:hypothetical protein
MAIKPADMESCSPKCKCLNGPNIGEAYECDDPCQDDQEFDFVNCECNSVYPTVAGTWTWTGTITDIIEPTCLEVSGPGYAIYQEPDANINTQCAEGASSCSGSFSIHTSAPAIDGSDLIYYLPSLFNNGVSGSSTDSDPQTSPLGGSMTSTRNNPSSCTGGGGSVGGYQVLGWKGGAVVFAGTLNSAFFSGAAPCIQNTPSNNNDLCAGTGFSVSGTWTFTPD